MRVSLTRKGEAMQGTETYSAGSPASEDQLREWVEQFHRDGYHFIPGVLPPEWTAELRGDLDRGLQEHADNGSGVIELRTRMFEISAARLDNSKNCRERT